MASQLYGQMLQISRHTCGTEASEHKTTSILCVWNLSFMDKGDYIDYILVGLHLVPEYVCAWNLSFMDRGDICYIWYLDTYGLPKQLTK